MAYRISMPQARVSNCASAYADVPWRYRVSLGIYPFERIERMAMARAPVDVGDFESTAGGDRCAPATLGLAGNVSGPV